MIRWAANLVYKICVMLLNLLFKFFKLQLRLAILDRIPTTTCLDSVEVFRSWRWLCLISQIRVCQNEWFRFLSLLVELCDLKSPSVYLYHFCRLFNLMLFLFVLLRCIFFFNYTVTITCDLVKQQMIWNINWQVLVIDLRKHFVVIDGVFGLRFESV